MLIGVGRAENFRVGIFLSKKPVGVGLQETNNFLDWFLQLNCCNINTEYGMRLLWKTMNPDQRETGVQAAGNIV